MLDAAKPSLILNVNDNEQARYVISRTLAHGGYEVLEATNGAEALLKAKDKPDLVVLDVQLPDISGFEICRRLKADPETESMGILLLSAHVTESRHRAFGLEAGADAYLTQPVDSALLSATIRTVLRIRRAEAELRSTVQRLEQERELRENFVLTLSHDLRNPLSAASTNAQLILRYPDKMEKHLEFASRITTAISRADKMITDLLDASRIRVGDKLPLRIERCDLSKIIIESVDESRRSHGERFEMRLQGDLNGYASCDDIKRILENLLNNAVKYGSAEGVVTVSATGLGSNLSLSVHNEGKALSDEEQSRIFELFQRTHDAASSMKKGWGLGLPLVRGIAEAHGGRAFVQSSAQSGTTFTVILPRDARSAMDLKPEEGGGDQKRIAYRSSESF